MPSGRSRIPTYHAVPRFDIAADGGPLQLGTILGDLHTLKPVGRVPVAVPEKLMYAPVVQTGFRVTRASLRKSHFGMWAKMLGHTGAPAKLAYERDNEETISCESLVTTYFDPDQDYVRKSLNTPSAQDYLIGSGFTADLFLVTGLKVAKKLSFDQNTSKKNSGEVDVSATVFGGPIQLGLTGGLTGSESRILKFDTDDIVIGYRVTKFRHKRASILPWKKGTKVDENEFLEGAELYDDQGEPGERILYEFEEVPIEEELQWQQELSGQSAEDDEYVIGLPLE